MKEDEHTEFFGFGPEEVELRVAEFDASDTASDGSPTQTILLDALLELLGSQIGELQGHCGESNEAVGMLGARLGEFLVLNADDLLREVALYLVPVWVDAERLHVDALRVHGLQAQINGALHVQVGTQTWALELEVHQRQCLRHCAMGVDVDRLRALPVDHDFTAAGLGSRSPS